MATIQTGKLTSAGYQPIRTIACDLAEAAEYEPEGVYTITRTFQRDKALLLDTHLDRLEESARLEQIPLQLDRAALRAALRTMIKQSGYAESRFRITVSRANPDQIYLALEPLKAVPEQVRSQGVKVALVQAKRHNPAAKTTAWMSQRREVTADLPSHIYESILLGENGELLEGTSSNFYAVRDGVLHTAQEGILNGISRRTLLAAAENIVPLALTPVTIHDLPHLSEAMITSSSRGVIPVIEINGQVVGNGIPGTMTLELQRLYDEWTEAHLEPI